MLAGLKNYYRQNSNPGEEVFKLHATFISQGLTTIIANEEYGFTVDEAGYPLLTATAGFRGRQDWRDIAVDQLQVYASLFDQLKSSGKLPDTGVAHNPYDGTELPSAVVAIVRDGTVVDAMRRAAGRGHPGGHTLLCGVRWAGERHR
ncbi:MAG: hypothetical protein U0401_02450 [Anaerolineae bacterium]